MVIAGLPRGKTKYMASFIRGFLKNTLPAPLPLSPSPFPPFPLVRFSLTGFKGGLDSAKGSITHETGRCCANGAVSSLSTSATRMQQSCKLGTPQGAVLTLVYIKLFRTLGFMWEPFFCAVYVFVCLSNDHRVQRNHS